MAVLLNDSASGDQDAMAGAGVAVVFLLYKQAFLLPLILIDILLFLPHSES